MLVLLKYLLNLLAQIRDRQSHCDLRGCAVLLLLLLLLLLLRSLVPGIIFIVLVVAIASTQLTIANMASATSVCTPS